MGPRKKAAQLRAIIRKQIATIPLASYPGSFGGVGGLDYSGRDSLEKWFVVFYAKSKLAEKKMTAKKKAYWKKVLSLA